MHARARKKPNECFRVEKMISVAIEKRKVAGKSVVILGIHSSNEVEKRKVVQSLRQRFTITRSKKGPFIIAEAVGAPILPVTIVGTELAWPPGDWRMYGGKARVVIHPLVEQTGDALEMRARIESLIRNTYDDLAPGT